MRTRARSRWYTYAGPPTISFPPVTNAGGDVVTAGRGRAGSGPPPVADIGGGLSAPVAGVSSSATAASASTGVAVAEAGWALPQL
jgi:hypothetical protein